MTVQEVIDKLMTSLTEEERKEFKFIINDSEYGRDDVRDVLIGKRSKTVELIG